MTFFTETFLFLFATGILFFVPGWFLLRVFLTKGTSLPALETWVLSFAVGTGFLNFLMIIMGKIGILFTTTSLVAALVITIGAASLIAWLVQRRTQKNTTAPIQPTITHSFSKHQMGLFLLLLVLTVLLKTTYLSHAILPTSTDLGHHMYWSKLVTETGLLPVYAKKDIITLPDGSYHISDPEPIADFIIGEHLPFAAVSILSGLDFLSAFPILFLLLINLLALLALVILTRTLAESITTPLLSKSIFTPQNVSLVALFLFGPLYTLASPQAKFVSGGVVGNTLGNLFIPLIILSYLRAFRDKRSDFLALGFFLTFALAYTHHLSTLMLLFTLGASLVVFLVFHRNTFGKILRDWWKLFFRPEPIIIALSACLFFFLVAMPTYIEQSAVGTALGTPTKTTRTGLSLYQVSFSSGEARVALGLAGLFFIAFLRTRTRYASAFLFGWGAVLLLMTFYPHLLFINIPSNRIGAYLSFPLGILAAFAVVGTLAFFAQSGKKFFLPSIVVLSILGAGLVFSFGSGSYDNGQTLLPESKALPALQTFAASRYLAAHTTAEDVILKDHNYITADAWMKLFFLRDYAYPLSRGFFKRYEDNPNREQCTLLMISVPNTARGEKCYTETGTNFVVVNPKFDITPFEKSAVFSRIYASPDIHIYTRNQTK